MFLRSPLMYDKAALAVEFHEGRNHSGPFAHAHILIAGPLPNRDATHQHWRNLMQEAGARAEAGAPEAVNQHDGRN